MAGDCRVTALWQFGHVAQANADRAQNLAFATPAKDSAFGGYAGVSLDYRPNARVSIFAAAEGTLMNDKSATGVAKAGVRVGF